MLTKEIGKIKKIHSLDLINILVVGLSFLIIALLVIVLGVFLSLMKRTVNENLL